MSLITIVLRTVSLHCADRVLTQLVHIYRMWHTGLIQTCLLNGFILNYIFCLYKKYPIIRIPDMHNLCIITNAELHSKPTFIHLPPSFEIATLGQTAHLALFRINDTIVLTAKYRHAPALFVQPSLKQNSADLARHTQKIGTCVIHLSNPTCSKATPANIYLAYPIY